MKKRITSFMMALALMALLPLSAFAAGGDGSGKGKGDGSGSGGGGNAVLALVSTEPADGVKDVSLNPEIQCVFTHNVTQGEMGARNLTLLSMETADGQPVKVVTWAEDAQVEPEERANLYLKPEEALEPGTTYVVKVAPGVEAKNGMVTQEEQSFTFTTEGAAEVESGPEPGSFTPISLVLIGIFVFCIVRIIIKGKKQQ